VDTPNRQALCLEVGVSHQLDPQAALNHLGYFLANAPHFVGITWFGDAS
jgi:hypothetical protein